MNAVFRLGMVVAVCSLVACGAESKNNGGSNNGGSNNGGSNNGGSNNGGSNNGANNGATNNGAVAACPTDNPLVGSCADLNFLGGCFEPDLTGTCSMPLSTEWSDGSKVTRDASGMGGFFGPDDTEACATYSYDQGTSTTTFERDGQTWTQVDNGDGTFTMTCPDSTTFDFSAAESETYNTCRGITCSGGGGGGNNTSAGSCGGAADCPGSVCCETAVSKTCVPDSATCAQVGGTVLEQLTRSAAES